MTFVTNEKMSTLKVTNRHRNTPLPTISTPMVQRVREMANLRYKILDATRILDTEYQYNLRPLLHHEKEAYCCLENPLNARSRNNDNDIFIITTVLYY